MKLDLEGLKYHACSSGTSTPPMVREQILLLIEAYERLTMPSVPEVMERHCAYVEMDFESARRGASCRTAVCTCGWRGPQRASLELVTDDALGHERACNG